MKRLIAVWIALVSFITIGGCATYSGIMQKKVQESLGTDFKSYTPFSYPTGNYGLLTSYHSPGTTPADMICDMWNCLGVSDAAVPTSDLQQWLAMNGFAAVGVGGAITLTESDQRDAAITGALPQILDVVNVTGSFSKQDVTKVTLSISNAYSRVRRLDTFQAYLNSLPADGALRSLKSAYTHGALTYVVADVVVDSMKVSVETTGTLKANLEAKLGPELPNPGISKVFKNAQLGVTATRVKEGTYTFDATSPVIILKYVTRQSGVGMLAADDDWKKSQALELAPLQAPRASFGY